MLSLVFVFGFLFLLGRYGPLTLVTRPLSKRIVLALPSLIVVFTLGTTVGAVLAWRNRYWSRVVRIHQTLLALFGIGLSWQLAVLGFFPG